jgi:hypothetical protein
MLVETQNVMQILAGTEGRKKTRQLQKQMPKVTPPFCRVDDKLLTINVDC